MIIHKPPAVRPLPPWQRHAIQRMEQAPEIRQPTVREDEVLGRSCHRYAPIVAMQVAGMISTDQEEVDNFIKTSEARMGGGGGAAFSAFSEFKKIAIAVGNFSATAPSAAETLLAAVAAGAAVAIGVSWEDPNITFTGTLAMAGSGIKYTFTTTLGRKLNVEKPPEKDSFALRDDMTWRPLRRLNGSPNVAAKDLLVASKKSGVTTVGVTGKTGNHWIYALPRISDGSMIRAKDQQNPDRLIEIDAAAMRGADNAGRQYIVTSFSIGQKAVDPPRTTASKVAE